MVKEYSKDKRILLLEAKIKMLDYVLIVFMVTWAVLVSLDLLLYVLNG